MSSPAAQVKLLIWLKAKLMWRGFTRNTSALIGAILFLILIFPGAVGAAIGCYFGFTELGPLYREHLLRGVLLAVYLLWLLSRVFGYALQEDYDIGKLLLYPITPRQILAGVVLGSGVDLGMLLLLPGLVAVLLAFGHTLLRALLMLLLLVVFMLHTIALSQGIGLAGAGLLRSRRGRDLLLVLMPLFWICIYVGSQILPRQAMNYNWGLFLGGRFWTALGYTPPGLVAHAIETTSRGSYAVPLGVLLLTGVLAVASIAFAGWLVQLVYTGEYTGSAERRRQRTRSAPAAAHPSPLTPLASRGLRLPPVIEAIATKELHYLRRDPAFKFLAMQMVYMLAVIGVGVVRPWDREGLSFMLSPAALWGWTSLLITMETQFALNAFGIDGAAASVLFLFPASRREILLGKNLVTFVGLVAADLAIIAVLTAVSKQFAQALPLAVWALLATVVALAAGNLASVLLPHPLAVRGFGVARRSASRGVGYGLAHLLARMATWAALLPPLAAVLVPTFWVSPLWYALTLPLALAYVGLGYRFSLDLAAQHLAAHEVEIIEKLRPVE